MNMNYDTTETNHHNITVEESAVVSPTKEEKDRNHHPTPMNHEVFPPPQRSSSTTMMQMEEAMSSDAVVPSTTTNTTTTAMIPLPPPPYQYCNNNNDPMNRSAPPNPTPETLQLWVDVGNHIDKSQTGTFFCCFVSLILYSFFQEIYVWMFPTHSHLFDSPFSWFKFLFSLNSRLEECGRIV